MRKLKNWRLIKFEKERVSSQWDSPPPWKRETSAPASNFALRRRRCKKETRGDLATVQPEKDFCFIGADIHSRCFFLFFSFLFAWQRPRDENWDTSAILRPAQSLGLYLSIICLIGVSRRNVSPSIRSVFHSSTNFQMICPNIYSNFNFSKSFIWHFHWNTFTAHWIK